LNDEKLGNIEDVIFDHTSGNIHYVVVDTSGWLSSKKFLVPALTLRVSAKHSNAFEANLDKRQVETFPPYNESDLDSESKWAVATARKLRAPRFDPILRIPKGVPRSFVCGIYKMVFLKSQDRSFVLFLFFGKY